MRMEMIGLLHCTGIVLYVNEIHECSLENEACKKLGMVQFIATALAGKTTEKRVEKIKCLYLAKLANNCSKFLFLFISHEAIIQFISIQLSLCRWSKKNGHWT